MPAFICRYSVVVVLSVLAACGEVEMSCEAAGDVTPLCGVQMPEDLDVMPNDGGLLIGEYGDGGRLQGALVWYQPGPRAKFIQLVTSTDITVGKNGDTWGEENCPLPDQLSPHGIHLSSRGDSLQLLVVNHSSKEHVLFYEVQAAENTETAPTLAWRGCVVFPSTAVLNDVVALPDGGFAVTSMYRRENQILAQIKSSLGLNDGHVWRWVPGSGLTVMANSAAKMPNGIEVAKDGKSIWVNNYIEQELRQYDVATEEVMTRVKVANIDNSAWLDDGRLLLASHLSPLTMGPCFGITKGSCGSGYELVAVDTKSGVTEVIFRDEKGGPFGPATVAVPYQGKLYAGSFSGDRLAEITLH